MAVSSTTTLGCGRTIDQVWDTIGSPPDPHQRDCPDCRAARRDLRALRQATDDLQHEDDQQEPGPGLLDRVMQVARSEVRRGRRIPLHRPGSWDHGDGLSVSEQAVVAVVRRAAEDEPDVQVRRCSVDLGDGATAGPDAPAGSESGDAIEAATGEGLPSEVALTLRISVAATTVIPDVTARLRAAVHDAVEAEIGVAVTAVHLIVEDVHDIAIDTAIDDSATGADDDPA